MALGIPPSCMRLTWPKQCRRVWDIKVYLLGIPALARTFFGTRSCQVKLRIFLKVEGVKSTLLADIQCSGLATIEQLFSSTQAWYTLILMSMVSMELFQTLLTKGDIAAVPLAILVFSSASRGMLLEILEPIDIKFSTTSRACSPTEMCGVLLGSFPPWCRPPWYW